MMKGEKPMKSIIDIVNPNIQNQQNLQLCRSTKLRSTVSS